MRPRLLVGILAAAVGSGAPTAGDAPIFEQDVQPILSAYCLTCHGKSSPEQGVDLRTARTVLRGGFNGPVVKRGSPDESLLYQKLSQGKMPPKAFKSQVPEADVETIRHWIEAGARTEQDDDLPEQARLQIARFEHEIQPLLNERCVVCHGGSSPQSGLDLRTLASTLRGGKHGPVVLEGFSEKSILVRQLVNGVMPPEGASETLSDAEVELIRDWIDEGHFSDYVDLGNPLDRAFTEAEAPPVTESDRQHWAFQAPLASEPPEVKDYSKVRTPIDAFLLERLEQQSLTYSTEAPRQTLLRRAYFDLWGLPPTPEQAAEFLSDDRPDAYERLLDRLLESHRYGQRWGRFWLDAAGYVDTKGKDFQADRASLSPGMWRYRDYVIDSFNADKPWDRFLTEQLAGDELYDWRIAEQFTPEMLENLIATGYLRTVLDATDEDISDRPADRYDTLFALIDKVSRSAVGLTLSCARCHSHKFDPIPQRDYYRFLTLLSAAYNPSDWIQPKKRLLYTVSPAEKERIDRHNKTVDSKIKDLTEQVEDISKPYRDALFDTKLQQVPSAVREDVRLAFAAIAKDRIDAQKAFVKEFGSTVEVSNREIVDKASPEHKERLAQLRRDIAEWKGYRTELERVQALWDGETLPTIRLLQRGSVESPGPAVKPGFLSVLCGAEEDCLATPSPNRAGKTTGYRLALAEWLTDPEHPLTARVIVNRIWQHHFGTGIVATPDNFGTNGSPPSHPELLDWLAVDFVRHGWKVNRLHKMIMLSAVYRQSASRGENAASERAAIEDPDNRLLWRMPLRRLEAEALRDSILAVGGKLDDTLGGPPVKLDSRPDGLQVPTEQGAYRRSVYLTARRAWSSTFMGTFDFPNIDTTCTRRAPSATPLQSLTLMNSGFVFENAAAVARRVLDSQSGRPVSLDALAGFAYRLVLARAPSSKEIDLAREHLEKQQELYVRADASTATALAKSVESLTHMLISSNEFLYVD
ncbi:MAG: PSD1 and planctomycete cytochrome C domain-containing protein [Bryobacterales bacterium]|nr:PSD1 and planctomycete cytochrome C domain-containing protein [Bryobacterales bacterium]